MYILWMYSIIAIIPIQVTTLWGSFEIKNVRLIKNMLKQFSG